MKITTFDPVIISSQYDDVVSLFKELGFETTHNPTAKPNGVPMQVTRMKHKEGFHIDIIDNSSIPRDISTIRMNVDDFDTAHDILIANGFTELYPDAPHDSTTHIGREMISPTGLTITLMQHIRKNHR